MSNQGPKIIGFRGKKSVGKNFVAQVTEDVIEEQVTTGVIEVDDDDGLEDVEQGAFADTLKNFCMEALGLTREQCHGLDSDKNTLTQYSWESMPAEVRAKYPDKSGGMTAREVMQVFGTDIMRSFFGEDIWVNCLRRKIESSGAAYYLVTDVRFSNECKVIREWGGEVWQIDGPQRGETATLNDKHPSETELEQDELVDYVIDNGIEQTKETLRPQIAAFLLGTTATKES